MTKFWLDKGVDGFRLDAVLHYYENNTAKNVVFLNWFHGIAREINKDVYIVSEAWSDQLTIANYYKSTIDSFFNFPFSGDQGTIKKAVSSQNGYTLSKQIFAWQIVLSQRNPNAIDAPFLSNHDNDRSIGYFPDINTSKLAASIYLLMPGNPYIYYGEEIGMTGKGKDENKRQPLVWSVNDKTGIPSPVSGTEQTQNLTAGIDEQLKDPDSLLSHYKNILKVKSENPEIARGKLTVVDTKIKEICFYSALYNGSTVYIVHNLSDKSFDISLPDGVSPKKIVGALYTSGGESQLNGNTIIIAQKSTLVLK
jgi:alpha-amylase